MNVIARDALKLGNMEPNRFLLNIGAGYTVVGNETVIDFGAGASPIPAGVKRVTLNMVDISTNGTSDIILRLIGSSVVSNGYSGNGASFWSGASQVSRDTTGVLAAVTGLTYAAAFLTGSIVFERITDTRWMAYGSTNAYNGAAVPTSVISSTVDIASLLTGIRLTTVNGTDKFDSGFINISWEF